MSNVLFEAQEKILCNPFYTHMNNERMKYIKILIFTSISENTVFVFRAHSNGWGKSLFACMYIEPVQF